MLLQAGARAPVRRTQGPALIGWVRIAGGTAGCCMGPPGPAGQGQSARQVASLPELPPWLAGWCRKLGAAPAGRPARSEGLGGRARHSAPASCALQQVQPQQAAQGAGTTGCERTSPRRPPPARRGLAAGRPRRGRDRKLSRMQPARARRPRSAAKTHCARDTPPLRLPAGGAAGAVRGPGPGAGRGEGPAGQSADGGHDLPGEGAAPPAAAGPPPPPAAWGSQQPAAAAQSTQGTPCHPPARHASHAGWAAARRSTLAARCPCPPAGIRHARRPRDS